MAALLAGIGSAASSVGSAFGMPPAAGDIAGVNAAATANASTAPSFLSQFADMAKSYGVNSIQSDVNKDFSSTPLSATPFSRLKG